MQKIGAEVTTDKILVDVEWYRKTDEEKAAFINEIKNKPEVTQGSKKAICECCGESLGFSLLKHSVPDLNGVDHPICAACANEAVDKGLKLH